MVRPVGRTVYEIPRLDIIRIRQPRWPLTPCLLRSHVWLYPRIIVSKSHDNTSMYVDTVINSAKYHIHTIYYIHTTYILRTYYVQNEWSHSLLLNSVQTRQKQRVNKCFLNKHTLQLNARRPNTCNTCMVAQYAVTNQNGAQKQLFRHRNFNYRLIPNTFVVY